MECYRVSLPAGRAITGCTADGQPACVYPGEYAVHVFRPKHPAPQVPVLRFIAADGHGRDVHVPLDGLRPLAEWLPSVEADVAA